ncbi:MAG: DnaB-like helicase N-terminal domain-containing protein, partial [Ignavibacteria bacterium]
MARIREQEQGNFEKTQDSSRHNGIEGKVPPHSIELEMHLLGGLMIDNSLVDSVLAFLKPKHFYKSAHSLIFQAISELSYRREPVDLITVTEELKNREQLDVIGGPYYLTELTESFASSESIDYAARRILEYWLKRDLINITSSIQDMCFDSTTETQSLLNKAQYDILDITNVLQKKPYVLLSKEVNTTM